MNEKQINMAERIITNTQRLLGMINDLLNQAQMEAGKLTIKMAPFRPADLAGKRACRHGQNRLRQRLAPDR